MPVRQLPNGTWFYRFEHSKRGFRKEGFRTREEALNAEVLRKAKVIRQVSYGDEANNTLKMCDAVDRYFDQYAKVFKRSWESDIPMMRAVKTFFGQRKIRDLSPRDVEAFRIYLPKTIKNRQKKPINLNTVNHYHTFLKAVINWTRKRRLYYGDNPAWGVEMAKVEKARVRFLLPEEEKRLTPVVSKYSRLWPYYVLGLHTGMRVGEISELRVRDVYLHPTPMVFIAHAKSKKSRYVPLSEKAARLLVDQIKGKEPHEVALDIVHKETVSRWFAKACLEAGIPKFTFHCLRHTFSAHMLTKGVPIYKVSKILGHSGVTVTEQHYGHLDRSALSQEIHRVEGIITMPAAVTARGLLKNVEVSPAVNEAVNGVSEPAPIPSKVVNN